jgi:hypothetical protein
MAGGIIGRNTLQEERPSDLKNEEDTRQRRWDSSRGVGFSATLQN